MTITPYSGHQPSIIKAEHHGVSFYYSTHNMVGAYLALCQEGNVYDAVVSVEGVPGQVVDAGEVHVIGRLFHQRVIHAAVHKVLTTEAEFLDEIQTKILRVFLLAIHNHLP
jgi:hypothetical protein